MMNKSRFVRFSFLFAAATFLTVSVATAAGPFQFFSVTPCRLADTRDPNGVTGGPILSHGVIRNFAVYGSNARNCGIPNDLQNPVKAVTLNITIVNPTSQGHLTAFPYNTTVPVVSTINYGAGEPALGNGAIVPLTNNASFQISILPVLVGAGNTVHAIIDITGYFQ
jgi:hypothetical protein